jgi:hypothetical protein
VKDETEGRRDKGKRRTNISKVITSCSVTYIWDMLSEKKKGPESGNKK